MVARVLNIAKASLRLWVRQDQGGDLGSVGMRSGPSVVTPEEMQLARLRAEATAHPKIYRGPHFLLELTVEP
jgi:transposase